MAYVRPLFLKPPLEVASLVVVLVGTSQFLVLFDDEARLVSARFPVDPVGQVLDLFVELWILRKRHVSFTEVDEGQVVSLCIGRKLCWVKVPAESIIGTRIILAVAYRIICFRPVATGLSALGRAVDGLSSYRVSDAFLVCRSKASAPTSPLQIGVQALFSQ